MINVDELNKYDEIVFYGFIPEKIDKYLNYVDAYKCQIVDSDFQKSGKLHKNIYIKRMEELEKNDSTRTAFIILPLAYEKEIYLNIRNTGFRGDVYADDMIDFSGEMEEKFYVTDGKYTIEKHTQILISLLKEYEVQNFVVSPGVCNMNFVYSIQHDSYFKLWSCVDERSAAYMACGIAQTTGKPVGLSCTGATASRNYMSALTEAFYSNLPIVAITSSRDSFMIGNGIEQITDRLHLPKDIVRSSVEISEIHNMQERQYCELQVNRALSKLRMQDGGPVHINLITRFEKDFLTKTLPKCRYIKTVNLDEKLEFPQISGRTALYIKPNTNLEEGKICKLIEQFCEIYDAVVIGDHLSNYKGSYFVNVSLMMEQEKQDDVIFDTIICVGALNRDISIKSKRTWKIAENGIMDDPFLNLDYFFDLSLESFLAYYIGIATKETIKTELYTFLKEKDNKLRSKIPELPFSNLWIANHTAQQIPEQSVCYFGIYSSLKNWNYFKIKETIPCYSTVGGFGIDGTMSAMIGSSIVDKDRNYYCFLGDLSFYYDLNVLGNKHIKNNVRIMVFNNDGGNSLLYKNGLPMTEYTGDYVGAVGHYNRKKDGKVIKAYAEALGFEYLTAANKVEYLNQIQRFLSVKTDRPIVFEIIYDKDNDLKARQMVTNINVGE